MKSRISENVNDWRLKPGCAEGSPCLDKLPSPHPSVYNKLFKLHLLMEDFQNNAKLILIDSEMTMFKEL